MIADAGVEAPPMGEALCMCISEVLRRARTGGASGSDTEDGVGFVGVYTGYGVCDGEDGV